LELGFGEKDSTSGEVGTRVLGEGFPLSSPLVPPLPRWNVLSN